MYKYSKILNSLVFKITFSFTIVVIGFMLALGFYVRHVALIESQNLQNEYNSIKVKRIENLIESIKLNPNISTIEVQKTLMDYSKISGTYITLYDQNNKKVFDSKRGFYFNQNNSTPVFQVIPTRNGNMLVEIDLMSPQMNSENFRAIQSLSVTENQSNLLLIDPPITNIVRESIKSITVIGIFSIMTAVFLIWLLTSRALSPISNIVETSKQLSKGDFTKRIPLSSKGELSEIIYAFNYMAEELDKLDNQRKTMIADIAHELRTPMTNLKGYIEGWEDGVIKPDKNTLNVLNLQVNNLSKIIDDLSTLSLAESGMLNMNITEFNLKSETDNIINIFLPRFNDNNIKVSNIIDDRLFIQYDLQRFTQIITNIINNAIIAMDSKESAISFSTFVKSNKLSLIISDTGKGISKKDLQNIFERFYRVDTSRNRNSGGSGLGLSIVKFLIESHKGKIKIKSKLNEGTDVIIDIKDFYLS
tara:strand:+ start:71231 stop:72655 length:1425 start_codon:yes stop_codon:yes gene_type:complete